MPELFTLIPPSQALEIFFQHLSVQVQAETVPTSQAMGRVTSAPVCSPMLLPTFPRSTMDGYAVRAADTYGASESLPAYLNIVGEVTMGRAADVEIAEGQVAIVHTGGMIPPGADAVVMVEHTQRFNAGEVEVLGPVAVGENVINVGEDVAEDQQILPANHLLRPQDIGGLLAVGLTEVAVARQPRVAIMATGDEVVPPEQTPGPGQVRDINSQTAAAQTRLAGGVPLLYGIIPDDFEALQAAARRALYESDVVVLSAGSSVSFRDMTANVINRLGQPGVLVHGISLKPGKPTILALCEGKPVFGMPGNPVSAMTVFDLIVRPTLWRLQGCMRPPARPVVQAKLARNVPSASGRMRLVPVRLEQREGELWADPVFGVSNLIFTLVKADGRMQVPLNHAGLAAGESVLVELF